MTIIDYRYDACGLDNVILKGLRVLQADDAKTSSPSRISGLLHRVLTVAVASKDGGLQPKELRFLRSEMGLTQAQLAALVGKEVQAIGRWERDENRSTRRRKLSCAPAHCQHATQELPPMEDMSKWTLKPPLSGHSSSMRLIRIIINRSQLNDATGPASAGPLCISH